MYYKDMKGGLNVTKAEAKKFLRICKDVDFIKFNQLCKDNNISQPAISRFINSDSYDDFISLANLELLCDQIYNRSGFINDMYRIICKNEKIA